MTDYSKPPPAHPDVTAKRERQRRKDARHRCRLTYREFVDMEAELTGLAGQLLEWIKRYQTRVGRLGVELGRAFDGQSDDDE